MTITIGDIHLETLGLGFNYYTRTATDLATETYLWNATHSGFCFLQIQNTADKTIEALQIKVNSIAIIVRDAACKGEIFAWFFSVNSGDAIEVIVTWSDGCEVIIDIFILNDMLNVNAYYGILSDLAKEIRLLEKLILIQMYT